MEVEEEQEQIEVEAVVALHEKQVEVDNMTMRELTPEELDKTNKGIDRLEKEIGNMKIALEFNERTIAFQKTQNEYQDYIRPYLRKKKEEEDKKKTDFLSQDLMSTKATLNNLHDQVKNGVEIKNKG